MRLSDARGSNLKRHRDWVSVVASVLVAFASGWAVAKVAAWWLPIGPVLANGDEILKRNWLGSSLGLFAILLVLPIFRKVWKPIRAAAVALLVIFVSVSPIILIRSPKSSSLPTSSAVSSQDDAIATLATRFWIVIVLLLFASCAWFGWTHLRHIRQDALRYFDQFKELSRANFSGTPTDVAKRDDIQLSTLYADDVEGESTLTLLLTIVYGIIAMSGSTIAYFVMGQHLDLVGDSVPFIFKNNEGFTAALSLLIIVLTSAAVPIYSDLVKKIDGETDEFEYEISVLAQNINGLSIGGDAIWKHFTDVGLPLFKEWQSSLEQFQKDNPTILPKIHFKQIFLPYLIYQIIKRGRTDEFDNYSPRLLDPFVSVVENMSAEGISLNTLFRGLQPLGDQLREQNHDYFHAPTDLGHSSLRVRAWLTDWYLSATDSRESSLTEFQQINRARVIKFLAFSLQGSDAVADWNIPDLRPDVWYRRHPVDYEDEEEYTLIPSSEHLLYELLAESQLLSSEKSESATDLTESLRKFKSRIRRHLNDLQKTEQDQPSADRLHRLIQQCDELDIDASVFWDDVILFQQIAGALTTQGQTITEIRSAHSRFLYYVIWYFSSFDKETRIGSLLRADDVGRVVTGAEVSAENCEATETGGEAAVAQSEFNTPSSAPEIRKRFERLHEDLSLGKLDARTEKHDLVTLMLADRRSALHNWIRATQAHRSRRILCDFEAKLDELEIPRQLGLRIIPSRSARVRHLRYLVRAPRSSRHPLRLVSTYDLPPESVATSRQQRQKYEFEERIILKNFKELRDTLNFSASWIEATRLSSSMLHPFLDAKRRATTCEVTLRRALRVFLQWICNVNEPNSGNEILNLSHFDLLSRGLQSVDYSFFRLCQSGTNFDPTWQETQWNRLLDYCRNPENHDDLRRTFFSGRSDSENRAAFDSWWRNFNSE
jgi:hypothetical protein